MTTEAAATTTLPKTFQDRRDPIVLTAIDKMGGCTAGAKALTERAVARGSTRKVGKTALSGWVRIPDVWVRDVRALTGLPLKKLRPDLFDSASDEVDEQV